MIDMTAKSKLLRMDNVLIVVDDLEAAKAFFAELGMELEGEAPVEGRWVDRVVGLNDVRADIAMMRNSSARSRSTRTSTGSASCVARRASSSDWPSSSAETSMGAAGGGPGRYSQSPARWL